MRNRIQAIATLNAHLQDLIGLRSRMEDDHVGRPRAEARIAECEEAIAAERREMEDES